MPAFFLEAMQAAPVTPAPPSPVEAEVVRIRALIERKQFAAALSAADVLAAAVPENRDVLYLAAVSRRYLNRTAEALATLERLQGLHPGFSRLYQERGHCYVALRDAPRAIEAFLNAVNLNPALPASWRTLQTLFRMTGQTENAEMAAGHVAALAQMPAEVITATALFSDGELVPAEAMIRAYLLKHGNHVEAMRLLARIGLAHDVLDDADTLLEAVLVLAPDYRAARYDYATALLRRHKHVQAIAELEKLLQLDPKNRMYLTTYATANVGLGDHERALGLYRELIVGAPAGVQAAELHLSVAHSLKALGRQQESIEAYHAAAAARPSFGDAYWSLANLKTFRFKAQEIGAMRTALGVKQLDAHERFHFHFALGKALEDESKFEESFENYAEGNRCAALDPLHATTPGRAQPRGCKSRCRTPANSSGAAVGLVACPAPIFIVGLPRSGSTLLEQILASHSQVEGTMELPDIIADNVAASAGRGTTGDSANYPGCSAH